MTKPTARAPALIALVAPALLAACAAGGPPPPGEQLGSADRLKLDRMLAGRVAGEAQRCLDLRQTSGSTSFGTTAVVYRQGTTLWRTELSGGCTGLRFGDALVTETPGTRLCAGDIARTASLATGAGVTGSCVVGPFVPYRRGS